MKTKTVALLASLALAQLANADQIAPTGIQYQVEAKIISADVKALAKNKLTLMADALIVSTNGPWWTGGQSRLDASWLARLEKTKGVDVLSAPRLMTRENMEAKIVIGQDIVFMEPVTNDLYRLTKLEDDMQPGVQLTITITAAGEPDVVQADVKFACNLLQEMTLLPNTTFKIGRPIMEHRAVNTRAQTRLGGWLALGGMQSAWRVEDSRQESLLVLLRITRVE